MSSWLRFGKSSSKEKPAKPSKKSKKGGGFMSNMLRHKTFGKAKETPGMFPRRRFYFMFRISVHRERERERDFGFFFPCVGGSTCM